MNNTENVTKRLRECNTKKAKATNVIYNGCFRHFAAANLSIILSVLIDFVKLFFNGHNTEITDVILRLR